MDRVTIMLQNKQLIEELINSSEDTKAKIHAAIIDGVSKRITKNVVNNKILEWLIKLLTLPIDGRNWLSQKLGNKLMHMSDAVKDGTIKNPYCLKNYTARMAWKHLQEAKKSKREAII